MTLTPFPCLEDGRRAARPGAGEPGHPCLPASPSPPPPCLGRGLTVASTFKVPRSQPPRSASGWAWPPALGAARGRAPWVHRRAARGSLFLPWGSSWAPGRIPEARPGPRPVSRGSGQWRVKQSPCTWTFNFSRWKNNRRRPLLRLPAHHPAPERWSGPLPSLTSLGGRRALRRGPGGRRLGNRPRDKGEGGLGAAGVQHWTEQCQYLFLAVTRPYNYA